MKPKKVAVARHCNLKAARRRASLSVLFLAIFYYFPASDQNSHIAIRFSDPDFLKESNNLAIIRRFHAVTLIFDI